MHFSTFRSEYECFQIELSKSYGQPEWREDIKGIMLKAGLQNQQITFLFVDTQVNRSRLYPLYCTTHTTLPPRPMSYIHLNDNVQIISIPQIKSESFLEDINSILNSGDVPSLYASEDEACILNAMSPVVQDLGLQLTKANLMAAYVKRVRCNIHIVLCMRLGAVQSFKYLFTIE